jgi:predicted site-specific integrase-resolvase
MDNKPWINVQDVCSMYGVSYGTAKNQIAAGTFPVMTYKVGKKHVIDRVVHEEYFRLKRAQGLAALQSTSSGRGC